MKAGTAILLGENKGLNTKNKKPDLVGLGVVKP